MSDSTIYSPPKVWTWDKANGGRYANINRPVAGPTHEQALPRGKHPLQLYSLATPNGVKVTVMLEELLALGHAGIGFHQHQLKPGSQPGPAHRQGLRELAGQIALARTGLHQGEGTGTQRP